MTPFTNTFLGIQFHTNKPALYEVVTTYITMECEFTYTQKNIYIKYARAEKYNSQNPPQIHGIRLQLMMMVMQSSYWWKFKDAISLHCRRFQKLKKSLKKKKKENTSPRFQWSDYQLFDEITEREGEMRNLERIDGASVRADDLLSVGENEGGESICTEAAGEGMRMDSTLFSISNAPPHSGASLARNPAQGRRNLTDSVNCFWSKEDKGAEERIPREDMG